ncbi:hypothetical protein MML48_4g00002717 [Holotrichia oblita]|uniref:Uncharacterized protein n=1 Tax=Holotrichia oblita TaxID=644536 RepID=A0ACB9T6F3_HOLOL|nr:hypothetical protein MML48_4g00002717 [Holotrichia oblita]
MKLQALLKRQSEGHRLKKGKTFTPEELNKFLKEAPDHPVPLTKVALIVGLMGACRTNESHSMKIEDIED